MCFLQSPLPLKIQRVVYNDIKELVTEWQSSGLDCSIWEYLELPEHVFKAWLVKCRDGVFDT